MLLAFRLMERSACSKVLFFRFIPSRVRDNNLFIQPIFLEDFSVVRHYVGLREQDRLVF